jgi:hypothetical protein
VFEVFVPDEMGAFFPVFQSLWQDTNKSPVGMALDGSGESGVTG